jgi:N-acetylglutamate synthase-like GNAT family acetyltransferase
MPIAIRPATAADQPIISAMVRDARLNPFRLHWRDFLIADVDGRIAGIGQVRPHGDGSRELSSLVVTPEHQGQGIGSQIVWALLARESEPTYLFCREALTRFYARFGFYVAEQQRLPRGLARMLRLGNLMTSTEALFSGHHTRIVAMRRDLPTPSALPINAPPAI